jgi:hypothetical protein
MVGKAGSVRVGFLEGSTCGKDNQSSSPEVAFYLEYGTKYMPPRPFFQQTLDAHENDWGEQFGTLLMSTGLDVDRALGVMGEKMTNDLYESIIAFNDPPDSPATIAKKKFKYGRYATLIDSGNLLNSVGYAVNQDGIIQPFKGGT